MTSISSPARVDGRARPVDSGERVLLLDVLRAFALCGVFIANTYFHFSGRFYLPRGTATTLHSGWWDSVAAFLFELLISEKAMTVFSFLFGLGFALQMGRARERGSAILPVYARRLGVLVLIGLTHLFALWYGDILTLYALLGFVLLLFREVPDRRLLLWSLALILGAPFAIAVVTKLLPLLASSREVVESSHREAMAQMWKVRGQSLVAFSSGSYLTSLRANVEFYLRVFIRPTLLSYALMVLGRFLLGLVVGRRRLLEDVAGQRPFFRKLLGWGLCLAVVGNGLDRLLGSQSRPGISTERWPLVWQLLQPSVWEIGVLGLAACYVAGLALLFQRPGWRRVLGVLAPAGQMALTNYLCQTLISQFVYYGYGFSLIGKLGPAACILLTFTLFWVQVGVSHLWLARFRFGPMEWVWRSLTYGKRQPLLRVPERTAEDVAPAA